MAVLSMVLTGGVLARVIHVPTDHSTVRNAVNAAASGDTILLAPGTHAGGVYIKGKRLTLASRFILTQDTSYIAQTVIDTVVGDPCGGDPNCVGNVVLEFAPDAANSAVLGLTIQRGEDGVRSRARLDLAWCRVIRNQDGIDYRDGAGGTVRNTLFMNNGDDGIDINGRIDCLFTDNVSMNNHEDGVEFRMYPYQGPTLHVDFIRNRFTGNGGDGIQLIDYADTSARVIRIEHNYFSGNDDASIGCLPSTLTQEDYSGQPIPERIFVIGNTFRTVRYGMVGGANVIALNNLFSGATASAVRRVSGNSIVSYSLFWNNAIDDEQSVIDAAHRIHADPRLTGSGTLGEGSPAIDAGTASYQWRGETVLNLPPSAFEGRAPDLGAFESQGVDTAVPPPAPMPGGVALHAVVPTPSSDVLGVELSLMDGTSAILEVLDVAGRRVWSGEIGVLGSGRHRVDLRPNLAVGTYLVRLTQAGRAHTIKAVVLR